MKKILGLDLGTTSIGWALVNEADNKSEVSEILKLGVRVNPLSSDEIKTFEEGKALTVNLERTLARGARRNLQRFKQRRKFLIKELIDLGFITKDTSLAETGKHTTHDTLKARANAVTHKIEKQDFARVLLAINKKRGYKSSRKAKSSDEGELIDGMAIAKILHDKNITPGQFVNDLINKGGKYVPTFYKSDLRTEFDKIWNLHKIEYANVLTSEFYEKLEGQGKVVTTKLFLKEHTIYTAENKTKDKKKQHYIWRAKAVNEILSLPELAYVLVEINNNINGSSAYLGEIGDRSKELYFNNKTVGQYQYEQIEANKHTSLRNQVFYRQDYLDEFEVIWDKQAEFYSEMTEEIKKNIRDIVIFYQRRLKSQKHLVSDCTFEKYKKAAPKSSPLFQVSKVWQSINKLEFREKKTGTPYGFGEEDKEFIFEELNIKGNLKLKDIFKSINLNIKDYDTKDVKELEGNSTNQSLYKAYQKIAIIEGYGEDWDKKTASEIKEEMKAVFTQIGVNIDILEFDSSTELDKQESYKLWHLLYSAEDDTSVSKEDKVIYGDIDVSLKKVLHNKYGFKPEYAAIMSNVHLQPDYGSLSSKALNKIIPYLEQGQMYDEACSSAKYRHSKWKTKEEKENRELKGELALLEKNSLRNPVVEKILNQMVNVVNELQSEYGKVDEVRIEMARELKKSAKERKEATEGIASSQKINDSARDVLRKYPFNLANPTRNDIIKYRLYEELSFNGYKTLYTNKKVDKEMLFSKNIEIEHIIPKARLFDDSFSNKTLAFSDVNGEKADTTAIDFIENKRTSTINEYKARIEDAIKGKHISKTKYTKLLMKESEIPDGFIDRELRNTQYIAKKAKEMLEEVVRTVNTTTGIITDRLRNDWDIINVMKEISIPRYRAIDPNMIIRQERKKDKYVDIIEGWTKRNDHRHHAMDALIVAFTSYNHVNILNFLNSKKDADKNDLSFYIKEMMKRYGKNGTGSKKFIPPMGSFREEAKKHIEEILISFKAKNKVVTKNKNKTKLKGKDKYNIQKCLTPRGQLHKETIYGKMIVPVNKIEKIGTKFDADKISQVTKPLYKQLLLERLEQNGGNSKKAFGGINTLAKKPIYTNEAKTKTIPEKVNIQFYETKYTIRKDITHELKVDKVIDKGIQQILKERLKEYNNKPKEAFVDLDKNPIWLDKEKGISIKRVTIQGIAKAESLHDKKDNNGELILDNEGKTQAVDFVSTGNNHHVAIYEDEKGKYQEKVVSLFEAVARVNGGLGIIDKEYNKDKGWKFLFTMKQNEMFLFPSDGFEPKDISLDNYKTMKAQISKNLFRVQKITYSDYMFAHHLETKVITNDDMKNKKQLKGNLYHRIKSTNPLKGIVKIRINNIGEIVNIGEY
ncbi:MAG: type II CRISPR RNA-guided endonuclease Cas9 [Flavobacteriaceae bacterium]|nr:type II CRISPR RNA-guided endonuclease Cas9 [Flavobacteriaceae bacterium]